MAQCVPPTQSQWTEKSGFEHGPLFTFYGLLQVVCEESSTCWLKVEQMHSYWWSWALYTNMPWLAMVNSLMKKDRKITSQKKKAKSFHTGMKHPKKSEKHGTNASPSFQNVFDNGGNCGDLCLHSLICLLFNWLGDLFVHLWLHESTVASTS